MADEVELDFERLGRLLLQRRGSRTMRDFAEQLGIAHTYLSKMESGKANVSLLTAVRVARAAEIPMMEMLDAVIGLDRDEVEAWALENTKIRANLEEGLHEERNAGRGRVVVEAAIPEELERLMRDTARDVAAVRKAMLSNDGERLELEAVVAQLRTIMVMAAPIAAAMEQQWETMAPPASSGTGMAAGAQPREDGGELAGAVHAVEGNDGSPR